LNDDAEKRQARQQPTEQASEQFLRESIECNCTESVLGQSGGAERTNERTNDAIVLSSSTSRPSSVVKFRVTANEQNFNKKKLGTEVGTEWGCSIWVLNFGKA
jgi:hypothetical protein